MPAPYNLSQITEQGKLYGIMDATNTMSGGLFGLLIMIVFFIIMIFMWRDYEPKTAFASASFLVAIIAIFLRMLQWIPDAYMFGAFIVAGVSFVVLKWG